MVAARHDDDDIYIYIYIYIYSVFFSYLLTGLFFYHVSHVVYCIAFV